TRRGSKAGSAAEAVGPGKRRRLLRLARYFLAVHGLTERACRFDVVSLTVAPGRVRVALLRDAFAEEAW
ncbi:MAG: YraN family protein, partial [Armatimonadota bacterium]|nr:YraN family protein [Armatimonadota bacterium]